METNDRAAIETNADPFTDGAGIRGKPLKRAPNGYTRKYADNNANDQNNNSSYLILRI